MYIKKLSKCEQNDINDYPDKSFSIDLIQLNLSTLLATCPYWYKYYVLILDGFSCFIWVFHLSGGRKKNISRVVHMVLGVACQKIHIIPKNFQKYIVAQNLRGCINHPKSLNNPSLFHLHVKYVFFFHFFTYVLNQLKKCIYFFNVIIDTNLIIKNSSFIFLLTLHFFIFFLHVSTKW